MNYSSLNYCNYSFSIRLKYQQVNNWVSKFSIFMGLQMSVQCLHIHRSVRIIIACASSQDPQPQYYARSTIKYHDWRHSNIKYLLLYCMGRLMLGVTQGYLLTYSMEQSPS